MHTAFHSEFNESSTILVLSEEESRHLVKVLRHTEGKELEMCNGKGIRAIAKITLAHPKKCEVQVISTTTEKAPENILHLAIAPTKNMDRLEWVLEKATEIGVDKITLLQCKNNERKVVKMERLEKILLSAMKQSQRYYLPELAALTPIQKFIEENPKGGIAHCYDNDSEKVPIAKWNASGPILIGPEGDFTVDEVNLAKDNDYTTIELGRNRLRTETAAVFVVSKLA